MNRVLQKEPVDEVAALERYPEVVRFSRVMARQLARHAHKGNQEVWRADHPNDLLLGAYRELYELQETLRRGPGNLATAAQLLAWCEQVAEDAADTANFTLMIADNIATPVRRLGGHQ